MAGYIKKELKQAVKVLAMASSIGFAVAISIFLGYAAGFFLDKYFGTKPWLTIIFLLFGIVAGFKNIYVIMKRVQKMSEEAE